MNKAERGEPRSRPAVGREQGPDYGFDCLQAAGTRNDF